MANWVIRRVSDGRYYSSEGWRPLNADTLMWSSKDSADCACEKGEEPVELDDAGQPVEAAKPVRMWVVELGGLYYGHGSVDPVHDLANASRFPCEQTLRFLPGHNVPVLVHPDGTVTLDELAPAEAKPVRKFVMRSWSGVFHVGLNEWTGNLERAMLYSRVCRPSHGNIMVPVLVHPDGTVTLDEPAPAIAQPSPYSDTDAPIPYRLTERRVYLASALPNRGRALALAAQLARDGVEIVSTWHDRDDATVEREAAVGRNELAAIAEGCLAEIDSATDLVWMHGHAEGRVGAAVEVGYALARGKRLLLLSLDGSPAPSAFGALGAAVTVSGLYRAVAR